MGWPAPRYAHHALLTDADGRRLAKRDGAATLRALREAGGRRRRCGRVPAFLAQPPCPCSASDAAMPGREREHDEHGDERPSHDP